MTFEDGISHGSEQLLVTSDGVETPVMVHTTPIRDDSGTITAVMEMHTEIREVKKLQGLLKKSEARLSQLFEEVPCFITVQGPDRIIQHSNRRFEETFGAGEGDYCFRAYKHREEQCLVCPMHHTFSDGEVRRHEEVLFSAKGERLNVMCTTAPLRSAEGEIEAVIEMGYDITEIRQLQSQLTSIGLLVGSISHGIKGLLTGLDGGIYLVNSGFSRDKPERVEKGWEMVQRNVSRIRSMVMDILYYAKDRELKVDEVDCAELVSEIGAGLQKKASDLDIVLQTIICDEDLVFAADRQAIRATLINLLENSLDACRVDDTQKSHRVRMTARRSEPWIVFEVEDDGVGMDRETREKVFSLFFSSKGIKGTGLGLFIANKIVDKHGGTIKVTSERGEGSLFVVKLPIEARPSIEPELSDSPG